jgi:hypothetical protein
VEELQAIHTRKAKGKQLPRDLEAEELDEARPVAGAAGEDEGEARPAAGAAGEDGEDPSIEESLIPEGPPPLSQLVEGTDQFLNGVYHGYPQDALFSKILENMEVL